MVTHDLKRKLTAILSADVEGYSRLMGEDEEATVRTITAYREVIGSIVHKHRGRVVDSPGDNILAEFASVVDAVRGAVEIQEQLKTRNAELSENRRMEFRIGVNLGDVIHEKERIYGDGVNIAARIESLADGGGISISGSAFEQVKNKLELGYEYLGEHSVKNIAEPVRVYRVLMEPEAVGKVIGEKRPVPSLGLRVALAAAIVLLLVVGGVLIWRVSTPPVELASVEKMAFPLPDKPSVAVLAFDNMTGDPQQEYLSDGISENIISALSKISKLFVIARNSTFSYKGKPVKVQQVSEELGVRYVVEGSVQKSDDQLRVTAQLIDAITGNHLWSERYDRTLEDIFTIQDEITLKILTALQVKLTHGEQARMWAKGTENLEAYLKLMQAREYYLQMNMESAALARQMAEEAIALDPTYGDAYSWLGATHMLDVFLGSSKSPKESIAKAIELTKKALDLDDSLAVARSRLGFLYTMIRQHERGLAEAEQAVALNPNSAGAHDYLGFALRFAGRPGEAIPVIKKAIRLNPFPPAAAFYNLGMSYLYTGQCEEAIAACEKALQRAKDNLLAHITATAAYSMCGREEKAQASAAEVLRINPKFSSKYFAKRLPYKDQADLGRYIAALRKAGLPDKPPLPLPDKPSIAVLPFDNLSGDREQEYFSDGLTEQIITNLSKLPDLFVIARNSAFTFKGKPVRVRQVSEELGVRYVLEGSVQKSGDRVRITAQLVDAINGHHLWAERYDRDLRDIFALQDDITKKILLALQVKLTRGESARVYARNTDNLDAYMKFLRALHHSMRTNQEGTISARKLCEEAIALDPNYADAYRLLAQTHLMDIWFGWSKSARESFKKAEELAQKSLALDNTNALTIGLLGHIYLLKRQHDKAIAEGERAIALNPNSAYGYLLLAATYRFSGRAKEGIPLLEKAIRLQPYTPSSYYYQLGMAYNFTGRYDEAIAVLKKSLNRTPDHQLSLIGLTVAYSLADHMEEARTTADELIKVNPKFSVAYLEKKAPYKHKSDLELSMGALRKAGLK